MTTASHVLDLDETGLERLAALIACELMPGDILALKGDLGAGKSTFARAVIRTRLHDALAEVPSPTFSLVQSYETPGLPLTHCDLYRLEGPEAAAELGLEDAVGRGALLVEWPERATALVLEGGLGPDRLEITLTEIEGGIRRRVALDGSGRWALRLPRVLAIRQFIAVSGWSSASIGPLAGDASARRYLRLASPGGRALVMDAPRMPDGPPIRDGKPYSRIAHLAEDVRPFVAVARHLRALGLSAPEILASDLDRGLLLLEDLGDRVFGAELERGASQLDLWRSGIDALVALHAEAHPRQLPLGDGTLHTVPDFDRGAMQIEIELLVDWYVPMMSDLGAPAADRAAFLDAWRPVLDRLAAEPPTLLLRDYHSPNLIALPERQGAARVGIIDFQDAMLGPAAYDLVSLLQDARLDVPEAIERTLLDDYCNRARAGRTGFDETRFRFAYAALGAQRNTKILGIFARLARRDLKPRYLQHIPRIWGYLQRDLADPGLESLRKWYDGALPAPLRSRVPQA